MPPAQISWPCSEASSRWFQDSGLSQLTAQTRSVATTTQTLTPVWIPRLNPWADAVFLSKDIEILGDSLKRLVCTETPTKLVDLNVWMRERSLAAL